MSTRRSSISNCLLISICVVATGCGNCADDIWNDGSSESNDPAGERDPYSDRWPESDAPVDEDRKLAPVDTTPPILEPETPREQVSFGDLPTIEIKTACRINELQFIGDTDGDGFDDVAAALDCEDGEALTILYGAGEPPDETVLEQNGTFGSQYDQVEDVKAVGDLDRDGFDDFLSVRGLGEFTVPPERASLFLGANQRRSGAVTDEDASASFQTPSAGSRAFRATNSFDIDNDGQTDLMVPFAPGREDGEFETHSSVVGLWLGPKDWARGDVGDFDVEIRISSETGPGRPGIASPVNRDSVGAYQLTGRLDADKLDDLILPVTRPSSNHTYKQGVYVIHGVTSLESGSRFDARDIGAKLVFEGGRNLDGAQVIGDFDADGYEDILVVSDVETAGRPDAYLVPGAASRFARDYLHAIDATDAQLLANDSSFGPQFVGDFDFNGDNVADLAFVSAEPGQQSRFELIIFLGGPEWKERGIRPLAHADYRISLFSESGVRRAGYARNLTTGDFNGDELDDIAISYTTDSGDHRGQILFGQR